MDCCRFSIGCDARVKLKLAERGGFEPPVEFLTLRRFSKPLLSTTQPPLRGGQASYFKNVSMSGQAAGATPVR